MHIHSIWPKYNRMNCSRFSDPSWSGPESWISWSSRNTWSSWNASERPTERGVFTSLAMFRALFGPRRAVWELISGRIEEETLPPELLGEIGSFCSSLEEPCVQKMLEDGRKSA